MTGMNKEDEQMNPEFPRGLKWTRQRKRVYEILSQAAEPLNAAQIYQLAQKGEGGAEYAPSTIYRILAVFEEKGLVEKTVWTRDGAAAYSLIRENHTHYAVCLECHRRIPLSHCPFAHISLEKDTGDFTVTGHRLELYGYCSECREKKDC